MAESAEQIKRVREYETIYILKGDVARESAEKVSARVADVLSREGGVLTLVETWGRRSLAYPVKKSRRGVYYYVKYLGVGPVVAELERNLRMLDEVLKYQTVQLRSELDAQAVEVNPDDVKFESVEPPTLEEEQEMSLARELGLEDAPREDRHREHREEPDEDDGETTSDEEEES